MDSEKKSRKLTKRIVDAMKPGGWEWCAELRGFGVRCRPSQERENGRRYFVVKYRTKDGDQKWITIGEYSQALPFEEARKRALAKLSAVKVEGADPAAVRDADKRAITVAGLCDLYLEAAANGLIQGKQKRPKKDSTLVSDKGRIERHIKPLIGNLKVKSLSVVTLQSFHDDVVMGKTKADIKTGKRGRSIVEGGRGAASRTVGLLGGILSFAVSRGIISVNPARGIKRGADQKRETWLTPEDYRALGKALGENTKEVPQVAQAIRILSLTGARRGEIEKLRWSEIDKPNKCFRFADTKEGSSVRPIGQSALVILDGIARSSEFVFPGVRGAGYFKGLPKAWKRIIALTKLPHVTPHTLRHSFASVANELGYTEPTIASMLGHASSGVTRRYIHHMDAALVSAADNVAKRIEACMNNDPAKILPITSKGQSA